MYPHTVTGQGVSRGDGDDDGKRRRTSEVSMPVLIRKVKTAGCAWMKDEGDNIDQVWEVRCQVWVFKGSLGGI